MNTLLEKLSSTVTRLVRLNVGTVTKRRPTTPVANTVKILLYTSSVETKVLRWGRPHEDDARQEYLQSLRQSNGRATVSTSGLVVDVTETCLAAAQMALSIFQEVLNLKALWS